LRLSLELFWVMITQRVNCLLPRRPRQPVEGELTGRQDTVSVSGGPSANVCSFTGTAGRPPTLLNEHTIAFTPGELITAAQF
jgi:hypothetical protein